MTIKYYRSRYRKRLGLMAHEINPPKAVREATGLGFETFDTEEEAKQYSEDVLAALAEVRAGERAMRTGNLTVEQLCDMYVKTLEFRKLAPNSKATYEDHINIALSARIESSPLLFGDTPVRKVHAWDAQQFYLALLDERSHHSAFHTVKVLRRIWNVAFRYGKVKETPFNSMDLDAPEARQVLWTPEMVETAISCCDQHDAGSLGTLLLLCYHLCQRPGDMRQLTWGNLTLAADWPSNALAGHLEFTQEKTKRHLSVPLTEALVERLAAMPRGEDDEPILLREDTGLPYTAWGYRQRFDSLRKFHGVSDHYQIRDLRRTGATEMAEAGATEDEIKATTGHVTRGILNVYVRPSQEMAAQGQKKRFAS